MFAEDISEDFSEDRRYHFYNGFYSISGYIFEIFAEDHFLLRSFRKFLPSGFLSLSRFQLFPARIVTGLVAQIARCNRDVRRDSNRTPPKHRDVRCEKVFR